MHSIKTKLNDAYESRVASRCFFNTRWHLAKTVGVALEEGYFACKNFHAKLEMNPATCTVVYNSNLA